MAKFRPHKSRRGPLPFRYVVLLTIVFFIFSTVGGIFIANKGLKPTLVRYAESQNNKIAASAVSYAIEKINDQPLVGLIKTEKNNNGNISSVSLNPGSGNKIAAQLQQDIQEYLDGAENGKVKGVSDIKKDPNTGEFVYSVPIGRATGNVLLGNIGPDIPIEFHIIGDTKVDLKTEYGETGINGTLVSLNIDVTVHVQTIIPFATKVSKITQTISLPGGVYQMDVPQYYNGDGKSSPPSIQLDGESEKNKKNDKSKNKD